MTLQALNRYYNILLHDPNITTKIPLLGYSTVGVSFALNISVEGELLDVFPLFLQVQRGKKLVDISRSMIVPQQVKKSVNIAPNFLWGNSVYVLGLSTRDDSKPEYSQNRFEAFRKFHTDLLGGAESEAIQTVLNFLARYDPAKGREHPAIAHHLEGLLKGGNLVFMYQNAFIHEDPTAKQIWESYKAGQDAAMMQCLVTGKKSAIARLHPSLKGVRGAQSSGASLVSFNERAYESYNRTEGQGLNSPVSEKAVFTYSTVLNYLLSDANPNTKIFLGDTTVVYWAEAKNRAYETAFASLLDPENTRRKHAEAALKSVAGKIQQAKIFDLDALLEDLKDENPQFYILGLAPNASRVSIRFFISDPFEKVAQNIRTHYDDLKLVKEFQDQPDYITVGRLLYETVSKKSQEREAKPLLAGAVFRAVLTNSPYPAALYYAIINRIRADMDDTQKGIRKINYVRAATIKAYLLRKYRRYPENPFKEVLDMVLNEQSTIPAYLLGRLFAVLEKVQQEAIGDVNASIKDRYFTSACASPASVFPILLRLSQHHIAKAEYGYTSDRRIEKILNLLDVEKNPIPSRLTLDEQGIFVLGYYHQRAAFYTKNDDQNNEAAEIEK